MIDALVPQLNATKRGEVLMYARTYTNACRHAHTDLKRRDMREIEALHPLTECSVHAAISRAGAQ